MLTRRRARGGRIAGGVVLFLVTASNSTRTPPPGDTAEAVGQLIAVLALVVVAVWLIASGLPKWIGDPQLTRMRRRIWYKLAGVGFVVMAFLAVLLAALSQGTVAILVTWAYWFGWTWIAWGIADRKAKAQIDQAVASPAR